MFTIMAARALVLVVAIAFSPSCSRASDEDHDYGMVEGSHLSLLQTAMRETGTQAKTKQAHPGRDAPSTDSAAMCTMFGDGGCTEYRRSFADISSATADVDTDMGATADASMTATSDVDANMGSDDNITNIENVPSSKLWSIGLIFNALTFLVCLDMLRLWYVKTSGDNSEDDGVSGPEAALGDAVDDEEEPCTTSSGTTSLFHLAAGNRSITVVEMLLNQGAEVDERDAHGETPLHTAARVGADEVCKFLLDQGAAINATNVIGWTPLGVSALAGKQTTCDLLLARGANAGEAASYDDVSPLLERCILEQADYHRTASGDSADVPADSAPCREGALKSLVALVGRLERDKAETSSNANEEFPDDSEDVFENGWDGWTWKEAAETTVSVA